MFSQDDFKKGIISGFISGDPDTSTQYQPQLVLNDVKRNRKTLEFVLDNLNECSSFRFAVAFVTRSGVACLHQILKGLADRGTTGEFLISTYLNFSEPHAIRKLSEFSGIKVHFVNEPNFHGKAYLFDFDDFSRLLIGSSNLTQNALGKNTEVNLTISFQKCSSLYEQTVREFNFWSRKSTEVNEQSLAAYTASWNDSKTQERALPSVEINEQNPAEDNASWSSSKIQEMSSPSLTNPEEKIWNTVHNEKIIKPENQFVPNSMQVSAIKQLAEVRRKNATRSLIISATGTGKTVLSAFDVQQFGAKRLLFLVHRLNIARRAMNEFRRVFGRTKTMGIYSAADQLNSRADFIFSTVQTMNREQHLRKFARDEFDYVIIDETHRAGALTYQKIIDYFQPAFLLGMTATPERTDGYDIFALFNHSVAYEIRLQRALEEDLISPFHYFGVADISVNGIPLDDKSDFNSLTSTARINHIIETLNDYGTDIDDPRGLIFCSRVDEARMLSEAFNLRGFRTRSISGSDPEAFREESIELLESSEKNRLDYIFTVDIFNEGVDIPGVNQVVMLRPTQSAIIFVQQLGRGLRKAPKKEYLTVIDFIGNYQNNYLIPVALFGDSSYNKDKLRSILSVGSSLIPGPSSISFDKIAKEHIFRSINTTNLATKRALTEDYRLLAYRLGKSPLMMDFFENRSRDPYQYVNYSGSLLAFAMQLDTSIKVNQFNLKFVRHISENVCDGKRVEEAVVVRQLLSKKEVPVSDIVDEVYSLSGIKPDLGVLISAIHSVNLKFATKLSKKKKLRISEIYGYEVVSFLPEDNMLKRGRTFEEIIGCQYSQKYLLDLCDAAITRFLSDFDLQNYIGGFKRGVKYTRKDVHKILQWDKEPVAQAVGGYIISRDRRNCPIFSTYHKEQKISKSIRYTDKFINPQHLVYMSKNRRTLGSPDVSAMANHVESGMRIPLFVKKSDDEGMEFYFLGDLEALADRFEDTTMPGNAGDESVVKMEFLLDRPVESKLYKHLMNV